MIDKICLYLTNKIRKEIVFNFGGRKVKVLVINCGSSSLKYQLIDSETEKVYAKGLCERIGIADADIAYTSSTTCQK